MTRKFWQFVTGVGAALLLGALLLFVCVSMDETRAASSVEDAMGQVAARIGSPDGNEHDMATVRVGESSYVGCLSIPTLGLELPVRSTWSQEQLRECPCRYAGSVASGSLVIAGYNYNAHFGRLDELSTGDEVSFVEMDSTVDVYEVADVIVVGASAADEVMSGEFALTLFTRSYDNSSFVIVRCERM